MPIRRGPNSEGFHFFSAPEGSLNADPEGPKKNYRDPNTYLSESKTISEKFQDIRTNRQTKKDMKSATALVTYI